MAEKPFFDTSVLVYLLVTGDPRRAVVEALVAEGFLISVQVLNEFAHVARRKLKLDWETVQQALGELRALTDPPLPITLDLHERAVSIAARYRFSFYDSLIVAAALALKCTVLYSEDLQHAQQIEGTLTVRNPFL